MSVPFDTFSVQCRALSLLGKTWTGPGLEIERTDVAGRDVEVQRWAAREGRALADFPEEITETRTRMLMLINQGDVSGAFSFIQECPPDLRAAVKPFFIHFSSATTKLATAHAVVDLLEFFARGRTVVIPGQVVLDGEFGGLRGPLAVPVLMDQRGWSQVIELPIANDERIALDNSSRAVEIANDS
tara:strand:+ start:465 stop:1022 length:558 start_codon:yes stop_codon:yes gene_type:complete